MKKLSTAKIIFVIVLMSIQISKAQTFDYYITNDQLISSTVFEFDVYIKNTSAATIRFRSAQHCITFNPAFINGATFTTSFVAGSTQLNNFVPGTITSSTTANGIMTAANTGLTCSNGTDIISGAPAVRVATYRMTATTGTFGCAPPNPSMIKAGDPLAPSAAQLPLRMSITNWVSIVCANPNNVTLTSGTYTNNTGKILYQYLNNMAPTFQAQVANSNACSGTALFSASVNGNPNFTNTIQYQWLENGIPIVDGPTVNGNYGGSQTSNLSIVNPSNNLNSALYSVIVSQCGSDTSNTAMIINQTFASTACNKVDVTGCYGYTNGSVELQTSGGSGVTTYTLSGSSNQVNSTGFFSGLQAGTYTITANNACGIALCGPQTITQPANYNDGNLCTIDYCDPVNGVSHLSVNIDDNNACTTDGCDPERGVFNNPITTTDGDPCTDDFCDVATGAITHLPAITDDGNSCSTDGCDPVTGVYHIFPPEICNNNIDDDCDGQIDEGCFVTLHLEVFIEGFYTGLNTMIATIDPATYPSLCDTAVVELRDAAYPFNVLFTDKSTIDINGNADFHFIFSGAGGNYYIVFRHRSGLETWSSLPVNFSSNTVNYSFASNASQAYGNNLRDLGDGNFAIWSGDISDGATASVGIQDGIMESQDYSDMENAVTVTLIGYFPQDITGDSVVESSDYSLEENNVASVIVVMRP